MAKNLEQEPSIVIPRGSSLTAVRKLAADCKACDLWRAATQTVFGEGSVKSQIILVGEQPGNDEDLSGRPFVGPAGKLLDRALAEAGIDRKQAYVTNAVKHFKYIWRGKRRIHDKPNTEEMGACRSWLEAEIGLIKPKVLILLGATAAQSLLGRKFLVTKERGKFIPSPLATYVLATVHPSSILRSIDENTRKLEMAHFVKDLRIAAKALSRLS
jgi:uracil-DNA glycosylase